MGWDVCRGGDRQEISAAYMTRSTASSIYAPHSVFSELGSVLEAAEPVARQRACHAAPTFIETDRGYSDLSDLLRQSGLRDYFDEALLQRMSQQLPSFTQQSRPQITLVNPDLLGAGQYAEGPFKTHSLTTTLL